jgi:hypothetical protein
MKVAIDPGKMTGVAVWHDGHFDRDLTDQYEPDQLYRFLETWGPEIEHCQIEWFTISARTIKTAIDYHALHLIGAVQFAAWTHQYPIGYTNPAEVKTQFPDPALKQAGLWHPSDHARDALRHLCYHLVQTGELSPRSFLLD